MRIKISKYMIPIIWLDTSILSNFQIYKSKGTFKSIEHKNYVEQLYRLIQTKTKEKKLIFALGDQFEELNGRTEEEFLDRRRTSQNLSMNIKMKNRQIIHNDQLNEAMKFHVGKTSVLHFSAKNLFYQDPLEKMNENQKYSISIESKNDYLLAKNRNIQSLDFQSELENVHKAISEKKVTYEEHLQEEYLGRLRAIDIIRTRHKEKLIKILSDINSNKFENETEIIYSLINCLEYNEYWIYKDIEEMWKSANNIHEQLFSLNLFSYYEKVKSFLESNVYKSLPYVDISSKLTAKIFIGKKQIASGDRMDIEHLSTVVPFVNYVVTDTAMKNHLKELEIDRIYNTEIYGSKFSDYSKLIEKLENL
ncbi:hypothetical protein PQ456_17715 [Paenibacillus kyungheensis]|uniref:DUF4935 domain-containing protein n=1 Tax=Paenibacillus kyungheensis TaxID=1452732 RepID=A0AAX3LZF2_9BACL|nr:hypothetical protein [Paenibacillus kyungheensis]WCT55005.1 hypothetical protein PQ456_17715 [Paenibacillus kyungheensis]